MSETSKDNEARTRPPRVTINKGFDSFDQFVEEYVTNISQTGLFIQTDSPLPVGSLVDLNFTVLMDEIETIQGEGEVVRVSDNPSGMGVVFRKLEDYSKTVLESLLIRL